VKEFEKSAKTSHTSNLDFDKKYIGARAMLSTFWVIHKGYWNQTLNIMGVLWGDY
jgi:hypothetical protein